MLLMVPCKVQPSLLDAVYNLSVLADRRRKGARPDAALEQMAV